MNYKKILLIFASLFFLPVLKAQNGRINPLKIGDYIPGINLENVYNYPTNTVKLEDLKGKLILLDFWELNCAPCIAAFPHLDSLQKKFKDQIQIFLITPNSKGRLDSTFQYMKKTSALHRKLPTLPLITGINILQDLFPYKIIPTEVWIDQTGKYRAMTEGRYVTAENIEKILSDEKFNLPLKEDFLLYDYRKPTFPQIFSRTPDDLKYYSVIMKYIPLWGSAQRSNIDSVQNTIRIFRGGNLLYLYGDAVLGFGFGDPYNDQQFDFGKRVILETKDSSKFFFKGASTASVEYENWKSNNSFIYESVLPLMSEKEAYKYFLQDLTRYFGITARVEKRETNCISVELLNGDSSKLRAYYPTEERKNKLFSATTYFDSAGIYHGYTVGLLKMAISKANVDKPYCFADNTNFKDFVRIEIKSSLSDLKALKKELEDKYHLTLVEKKQEMDFFVIKDL